MNFSAWNWATHFRLHEAACLIAGVMPVSKKHPTSEELPPQARPILVKLMSAYYEWVLQQHKPGRPKALCLEGSLNLDGTPPLPGLKELPSELVSREAIRRFLSEMQDSGHASVYDIGPPTQTTPIAAQYKDDGLIVQSALDRLDKAKKALVRREALLASPERPGGLAEQEALEVAVPTLKKEVAKAQQIVCTLRGDFLEKQQNTDFAVAFYSACLDLDHWTGLTAVQPLEAAMLLNNENPLSKLAHSGSVEIQKLLRVFEDHSAVQPARRTLLDWVQVAQERKAKHDSTVAEAVLAIAGAAGLEIAKQPTPSKNPVVDTSSEPDGSQHICSNSSFDEHSLTIALRPRAKRRDLLAPLIEKAQREVDAHDDASAVFALMRSWAKLKSPPAPLIGATDGGGIQWLNHADEGKELTISSLSKRIKRAKTHSL